MEDVERFVKELLSSNKPLSSGELSTAFKKFYGLKMNKNDTVSMLEELRRRRVVRKHGSRWSRERRW